MACVRLVRLVLLVSAAWAMAIFACNDSLGASPAPTEDSPGWDCATQGNRVCGTDPAGLRWLGHSVFGLGAPAWTGGVASDYDAALAYAHQLTFMSANGDVFEGMITPVDPSSPYGPHYVAVSLSPGHGRFTTSNSTWTARTVNGWSHISNGEDFDLRIRADTGTKATVRLDGCLHLSTIARTRAAVAAGRPIPQPVAICP